MNGTKLFSFFFIIAIILIIEFKNILEDEYDINFFFVFTKRIVLFLKYCYDKMKQSVFKKKRQIKEKLKQYIKSNKLNEKN